jgi:2-polyprenyl-6-methoxyphenol hydroxylase-like FAD-dependent oxidoreductase
MAASGLPVIECAPHPLYMETQCCIAGGGPAGMMLGLLLARAGVDVTVLEKHADFLRDFRGDTIHPSTLELMHELGILDEFLKRPHQKVRRLGGQIGDDFVEIADFSHLPTQCKFIALMPQWHFLDFLAGHARRYPGFHLIMQTAAVDLLHRDGRIAGVRAEGPEQSFEIRAALTVGADGRNSLVRAKADLPVLEFGAPMDVLWFRLPRLPDDGGQTLGRISRGKMMVTLNRDDYWQCAYLIRKGDFDQIKTAGLPQFRNDVTVVAPFLQDRIQELQDWEQIKLLTVKVDRLQQWYRPGLLCIGDAAHAMSPIGGVGINLAVQDAAAAANILAAPLLSGSVSSADLRRVQHRRELPARITQAAQVFIQDRLIRRVLGSGEQIPLPWPIKILQRWPFLRRIPARLIGIGFRPEHVQIMPAASRESDPSR